MDIKLKRYFLLFPCLLNMKKILFLIPIILLLSACFDVRKRDTGGDNNNRSPSSNIYITSVNLGLVKTGDNISNVFSVSNHFEEDADILFRFASGDGMSDASAFTVSSLDCISNDGYFVIPSGGECRYLYKFEPKQERYYTNVISIDVIGKSFYEIGNATQKKRTDIYFTGAGFNGAGAQPTDFTLNFNGINKYLATGSSTSNQPTFGRGVLTATVKNESDKDIVYDLVAGDWMTPYDASVSEFKLVSGGGESDCQVNNNSIFLKTGASCLLPFQYDPVSKSERGQMYLKPQDGSSSKRISFFGSAYSMRYIANGETLDWGKVGLNLLPSDTLLDLKGKIERGEDLTESFDNPFHALIRLDQSRGDDKAYTLDFNSSAGFFIDTTLSDCEINGTKVTVKDGGCDIVVAFLPTEVKRYGDVALSLRPTNAGVSAHSYFFRGEGVLMKRPFITPFTWLSENMTVGAKAGQTIYIIKDIDKDTAYTFEGAGAFNIVTGLYPGCFADENTFFLTPGAKFCRIYIAYSPPFPQGGYRPTFTLDGLSYKIIGNFLP